MYKNIGADGIKTGFLTVEKYSLASSIKFGDRRINAVASGFKTKNSRSRESMKLLNWGLRTFDTIKVAKKNNIEFPEHPHINKILLGDLAISLEYIKNQSGNKRIVFDNEIKKLIIHGILHLNGYDHENTEDEKEMIKKQNYILNKI